MTLLFDHARQHWHYEGGWLPDYIGYLPPDLTAAWRRKYEWRKPTCGERNTSFDTHCTRSPNHLGRHCMGDGQITIAVWP